MIWAPGTGLGAERGYVIEVLVALENTTAMTPMTSYSSVNADNIVKRDLYFLGDASWSGATAAPKTPVLAV